MRVSTPNLIIKKPSFASAPAVGSKHRQPAWKSRSKSIQFAMDKQSNSTMLVARAYKYERKNDPYQNGDANYLLYPAKAGCRCLCSHLWTRLFCTLHSIRVFFGSNLLFSIMWFLIRVQSSNLFTLQIPPSFWLHSPNYKRLTDSKRQRITATS